MNKVLRPQVVPFMQQDPEIKFFQQDNATPRIAEPSEEYLRGKRIKVLPWPPGSPDLSSMFGRT